MGASFHACATYRACSAYAVLGHLVRDRAAPTCSNLRVNTWMITLRRTTLVVTMASSSELTSSSPNSSVSSWWKHVRIIGFGFALILKKKSNRKLSWDRISLGRPPWPWISHHLLPNSRMLGLQMWPTACGCIGFASFAIGCLDYIIFWNCMLVKKIIFFGGEKCVCGHLKTQHVCSFMASSILEKSRNLRAVRKVICQNWPQRYVFPTWILVLETCTKDQVKTRGLRHTVDTCQSVDQSWLGPELSYTWNSLYLYLSFLKGSQISWTH